MQSNYQEPKTNFTAADWVANIFGDDRKIDYIKSDKAFYDAIINIYGNGDYEKGKAIYKKVCDRMIGGVPAEHGPKFWYLGTLYECLMPPMKNIMAAVREFPKDDKKAQTVWTNNILLELEKILTWPQLMRYMGKNNYLFVVQINGFREGDEDGDLQFFSNSHGDPEKDIEFANGLFNYYARYTRILPYELDRTQAGFR